MYCVLTVIQWYGDTIYRAQRGRFGSVQLLEMSQLSDESTARDILRSFGVTDNANFVCLALSSPLRVRMQGSMTIRLGLGGF